MTATATATATVATNDDGGAPICVVTGGVVHTTSCENPEKNSVS